MDCLANIVVGVVGAFLGGVVFNFFGVGVAGLVGAVINGDCRRYYFIVSDYGLLKNRAGI